MTGSMTAARFYEPGKPLRVEDVPVPRPAADEVLVRVRATGLCGSDVHIAVEGITPTPSSSHSGSSSRSIWRNKRL